MPKHLYPGYKQTRTAASATGRNAEGQQSTEETEEEDEGNVCKVGHGIRSLRRRRKSIVPLEDRWREGRGRGSKCSNSIISVCNRSQSVTMSVGKGDDFVRIDGAVVVEEVAVIEDESIDGKWTFVL